MAANKPKEKRIAEIVDAAVMEFAEKGYEKTSMNSIAKRANLSKGGIYHHFHSKNELLLAANRKVTEPASVLIEELNGLENPADKIRAYIRGYLEYWTEHSKELVFTFLSLSKSLENEAFFQPYEDYASRTMKALAHIFKEGIRKRVFKSHDCQARAMALCSALDGATIYLNPASHLKPDRIVGQIHQVFLTDILMGD